MFQIRFFLCLAILFVSTLAYAEWSSDPGVNLPVTDAAGDQVQPKVAPTADGGCYISWLDAIGNGFDVRLQKLDSTGDEVFTHNGILVADRGFSSTQDYGLDVDSAGNALLVFRDDRTSGVQITAAKISADGVLLWGTNGVQLTNTTAFVAAPKIAGTSDGGAVVAWTQDAEVLLQKLNPDGSPVWVSDVVLTPSVGSYSASDLHDTGTNVILSMVHVVGSFTAPKHLKAQKFDASGTALWGTEPLAVFDGGSLQFGNYPPFVTDGSGGAVFSWYDTSNSLQCFAQHVLTDGTEAFPHNGSAASTNGAQIRVSPWAAFNPATGETFLFWEEESLNQSQSGVYGQKFDAAGNRQWTNNGAVVAPVGTDENTQVRCLTEGAGAFVFWVRSPGFGQDLVVGARLDGSGSIDIDPFYLASTSSDKSRLAIGRSTSGFAILAWQDQRSDAGDIYAQNVNPDGTLGNSVSGVIGGGEGAIFFMGAPWPNPMTGTTAFEYSLAGPDAGLLRIFDLSGRVVRRASVSPEAGRGIVTWDGRNDNGQQVPVGIYLMQLQTGRGSYSTKVSVVR